LFPSARSWSSTSSRTSKRWNGPLAYAQQVKFLNSLPLVRVLEWAFIFIPLAFHAGYGVWIAFRGRAMWMYIRGQGTGCT
jgi:succinate dehydrogenase / fumarate reductase cytochrome b subunit